MASLFWGIVCIVVSVCHAAESDSELILEQLQQLTEAISNQKADLLSTFQDMKEGLKLDVADMITEVNIEFRSINNGTRNEVATLQYLLGKDECRDWSHNCSGDASCTDKMISFECNCKSGFLGDGYTCEDIDECEVEDTCSPNATCNNFPGHYSCNCLSGYTGDGKTCEDVDECQEEETMCHKYAVCENTPGNYTCTCSLYTEGDGYICKDADMVGCQSPFKAVRSVGCIHIIAKNQNYETGRKSCKELGGDLFIANNPEHYLSLAKYFIDTNQKATKKYMYVGVKDGVWLSGRKVAPEEEAPRNPSMGSGTCSYTDGDTSEKFLLWTDPCSTSWWALCQKELQS